MSDGGGDGGGGTFTQPSSPTTGLQRYNLEPGVKNLVPDTASGGQKFRDGLKRLAALRRDQARRASARQTHGSEAALKKDFPMLKDTIEAMVGTLSTSVSDIIAAGGDKREELLAKSFTEFKDAVLTASNDNAAELAKGAPNLATEEPLYKGLGTVGRVASLLSCIVSQVEPIQAGYDSKWQMPNEGSSNPAKPTDVPSADVAELLNGIVHMAELTLRSAVNEHVQLADDADMAEGAVLPPGMHLIMVPDADDAAAGAVVKTLLPEGLAKYATDPGVLVEAMVERGTTLMLTAGVPEETLGKLFTDEDPLHKAFPPKKKPDGTSDAAGGAGMVDDTGAAAAPADPNGGTETGADGNPIDATAGGAGGGGTDNDPNGDDPMAVAMRIWAALGIQLDHVHQLITGGASDMTGQAPDDGTDTTVTGADGNPVTKSVGGMGLAKRFVAGQVVVPGEAAGTEELRKFFQTEMAARDEQIGVLMEGVTKLLGMPAPAKGAAGAGPALLKQADIGSGDPAPALPTVEAMEEALSKMSPEDRALELTKMSQRLPEPNARRA